MSNIIEIQIWQIAAAYIFVLILLFIVRIKGIPREKEILISSIRMTLQLVLAGYILTYIFENSNPLFTIIFIAVMEIFAIYNTLKRVKAKMTSKLKNIIGISIVFGTLISIIFFVFVVIRITPWYDPRYFIPVAGMIIGNSMTGISLGATNLIDGMQIERKQIEAALMLGATPKIAAKRIIDKAFDASILPTINSMVGMGIVSLPGMMTGQILSGISPITAIQYQLSIMLAILGSVSLCVILFVQLGYKAFFNEHQQLEL